MPQPQISVPKPCHEAWAAMTPIGQGRHCAACQKTVVDFSQKSPAEILAFLQRQSSAAVCGRFRQAQVQLQYPKRLITWRPTPWLALSIVAVLTLTHCSPDPTLPPATVVASEEGTLLHGQVLDADSQKPLAGALIICEADTLCQTRTDAAGRFSLTVPNRLKHGRLIAAMPTSAVQRDTTELFWTPYIPRYFDATDNTTVLLRQPGMVLGETQLKKNETTNPIITPYLQRHGLLDACPPPPPPPPKLTTIQFTPPSNKH